MKKVAINNEDLEVKNARQIWKKYGETAKKKSQQKSFYKPYINLDPLNLKRQKEVNKEEHKM